MTIELAAALATARPALALLAAQETPPNDGWPPPKFTLRSSSINLPAALSLWSLHTDIVDLPRTDICDDCTKSTCVQTLVIHQIHLCTEIGDPPIKLQRRHRCAPNESFNPGLPNGPFLTAADASGAFKVSGLRPNHFSLTDLISCAAHVQFQGNLIDLYS